MSYYSILSSRLQALTESSKTERLITVLIVVNAVTLGLGTSDSIKEALSPWIGWLDRAIVAVFVVEITARLLAQGPAFFKRGWNMFDFIVIAITLIPATGNLSVLRALRILRVLRLVSVVPQMRKVVEALLHAIPGLGSISGLLLLVFYVGAVMATQMFGEAFPVWFGSVGASMYSLFQIMTLESWSMGIVRPVMEVFDWAWAFFVPFILLTSFAVLNLFIAVIVDAMQTLHSADREKTEAVLRQVTEAEASFLATELEGLRSEIRALKEEIGRGDRNSG
ncbi:MAG: ion transporter [Alphaproteobacteria bacterium]|nr:ion transporter [Alphaproteobacteria bacterium]MCY4231131.1 ion transporter [Alphaproteobacteria bacterium]MCY4318756.1 ion transporter [Alphaproteobacteria bacterium]